MIDWKDLTAPDAARMEAMARDALAALTPEFATHAQDILELSMLTMPQPGAPIVDISWEKSPLDL